MIYTEACRDRLVTALEKERDCFRIPGEPVHPDDQWDAHITNALALPIGIVFEDVETWYGKFDGVVVEDVMNALDYFGFQGAAGDWNAR